MNLSFQCAFLSNHAHKSEKKLKVPTKFSFFINFETNIIMNKLSVIQAIWMEKQDIATIQELDYLKMLRTWK
jgi:hypothetical protein